MTIREAARAAAVAVFSTIALAAQASSTFHPSGNEAGTENHVSPGMVSKAQRAENEREEAARLDPNWVFSSEAARWELRPHSYEIRASRIVHTDDFPHDGERPRLQPETPLHRYLSGGG